MATLPTFWLTTLDGQEYSLAVRDDEVEWGPLASRPADEVPGVREPMTEALSTWWIERVGQDFGATVLAEYRAAVEAKRRGD